jgi:ABC-type antimicrobial peptide transport system permease subunit
MKPRAAGMIGSVVALAVAVLGGYLLASPPWSIPGALVLVLASLALSISIIWTRRTSWAEPWPPDVTPSLRKQVRTAKVLLVMNCVVLAASIGLAVVVSSSETWDQLVVPVIVILTSAGHLLVSRRRLRVLQSQDGTERRS